MKIQIMSKLLSAGALGLFAVAAAQAADPLVPGKLLSEQQLAELAPAASVRIGGQSYRIASVTNLAKADAAVAEPVTMVVNERGVVGESRNEVLVSRIATGTVRQWLRSLAATPLSVSYYTHMDITTLRFATLAQAADARTKLQVLMPQARIDVPIQYGRPQPR